MAIQSRQPTVTADFFTATHRYSATIVVGNRRLTDVLNDRTTSYLTVKDVYVSRNDRPSDILETYKVASLIKEHITFIVVSNEMDGISQEQKYNSFIGRTHKNVFLTLATFEVKGILEIIGKFDLRAILAIGTTTFMSIKQGVAQHVQNPDIQFTGPVILVNKAIVEFFSTTDTT